MQQKGTHGFAQESYDDKGMWMESQAQQQQSHGFHEDSWNTSNNNNYQHKQQFPGAGMQLMKPSGAGAGAYYTTDSHSDFSKHHGAGGAAKLGGNYGMFHENMSSGEQGYGHGNGNHGYGQMNHGNGKKYPYGGGITTHTPHHQFSNGGGRFNHGGGHNNMNDYVSEEYEYEAHREEHGGIAKMEEKRYEHHNCGGDLRYANPYGGGGHGYNKNNMGMNMNMMRPHGYGGNNHKVEWSVKGV